ncbi:putative PDDEXK endonuclease [Endozoicomonas arenosclerae]|uniref:putative PDDEXK endonuclease n=1 Tax=Endozoicomonas arenosclerae TaxID=1633495 RepID=UPI0007813B85|nr:hypothetical protein [Endozoicomonas arenosclerae]
MSINSRQKGAAAEREFCKELLSLADIKLVRNLEQTRSGGFDLIPENQAQAQSWPWAIEVKRYASVTDSKIHGWLKQAVEQAELADKTPVLAYRADRQEWKVMLPVGQWNITPVPRGVEAYQWVTVDMGLASVVLAGSLNLQTTESMHRR